MTVTAIINERDRAVLDAALGCYRDQCLGFAATDTLLASEWKRTANHTQTLRDRLQQADEVALS